MYESYYGFSEKPFSLTPDPKYLYRSQSHGDAFDLLHYAIRRREGFVVVTGDIGTGKTTLCRAVLETIDRNTFTALVLNPFMSEEDLLKQNLQMSVLEQIRILSNLETDKEKLLQIILVGQLNLQPLLRSPEMRQLDQRVSIRFQLDPLDEEGVGSYIAHRLTVAGGSGAVRFSARAVE